MTAQNKSERPKSNYELYIMRHGLAVARGTEGFSDDSKRPLTPDGKEKMRDVAKGLKRAGVKLDWIVSSPLIRAVETAEIVAATLNSNVPLGTSSPVQRLPKKSRTVSYRAAACTSVRFRPARDTGWSASASSLP